MVELKKIFPDRNVVMWSFDNTLKQLVYQGTFGNDRKAIYKLENKFYYKDRNQFHMFSNNFITFIGYRALLMGISIYSPVFYRFLLLRLILIIFFNFVFFFLFRFRFIHMCKTLLQTNQDKIINLEFLSSPFTTPLAYHIFSVQFIVIIRLIAI